jgi:ubiquitin-protein ligase
MDICEPTIGVGNDCVQVFIEDTAGERFECELPADIELSKLAADFFEERGWPTQDGHGRGQRAVVELVDPENPDRTKRLRGEQTIGDAGLPSGATLRIFPESIAGAVDERERVRALVADHQDMDELVKWNKHITFEPNLTHAPTLYKITFDYPSFRALADDGHTPVVSKEHRVEIMLGAEYPRRAPFVRWTTPIFHPNIRTEDGAVCLGVLMDRYLPGLGLARLVTMLAEMVQYRNFDMSSPLNVRAAEWASDSAHWTHIQAIGGSPFQGPVHELLALFEDRERERLTFKPVNGDRN